VLEIIGAKGNIVNVELFLKKINDISKDKKIIIQAFNADLIYGKNHIISAYEHAKRAIDRNKNSTNSFEMEILLYTSGERQLKTAIPKIGVKKGESKIALLFIDDELPNKFINNILDNLSLSRDDEALKGDLKTLKNFGLSDTEIGTINKKNYENLILEKIALVDLIK
jgi:KEOPS complex subunit Cgi121